MRNQSRNILTSEERNKALLQLHIAEYEALMARTSNALLIQAGLLPIIPVYLYLVAQLSPKVFDQGFLSWTAWVGSQVIATVWSNNLGEHYTVIKYLECNLRPKIEKLFEVEGKDLQFWWYERYLDDNRAVDIKIWNYVIPAIEAMMFVVVLIYRLKFVLSFHAWDDAGCVVSATLIWVSYKSSVKANKIRREATMCPAVKRETSSG
jgi:hypothetical protein